MCQCQKPCLGKLARQAQKLHASGNSQAAYNLIRKGKMAPTTHPGMWFLKIRLGMAAGYWKAALSDLNILLETITPHKKLLLAKVECLIALDRCCEAKHILARNGATFDDCCVYNVLQARLYAKDNQPEPMIHFLQQALEKDAELTTGMAFDAPELAFWALAGTREGATAVAG